MIRKLVQNIAGRRNRIAAINQLLIRQLGCGDHAKGNGFISGDLAVLARRELGLGNDVLLVEKLGRLTEVIAGLERLLIRQRDGGQLFAEFAFNEVQSRLQRTPVEPPRRFKRATPLRRSGIRTRRQTNCSACPAIWTAQPTKRAIRKKRLAN